MSKDNIVRVTKGSPCPICDHTSWCSVFADGGAAICMRIESDRPTKNGGWIHRLGEQTSPITPKPVLIAPTEQQKASPGVLDTVYRDLLGLLPLKSMHRENLHHRGLSDEQIQRLGYKSLPVNRISIERDMAQRYDAKLLTVPGFYVSQRGNIRLSGRDGFLVPCRDVEDRIIGAQVRVSGAIVGGKYRWLSAPEAQRKRGGVSSGAPIHVAKVDGSSRVWITEGILKADIASLNLGETVLGVAGVTSWKHEELNHILDTLGPSEVAIAFDADLERKKQVRQARMKLAKAVAAMGYRVQIATWPEVQGKGIDDMLAAGHTPNLEQFRAAPDLKQLPQPVNREMKGCSKEDGTKRVKLIEKPNITTEPVQTVDIGAIRQDMDEDMREFMTTGTDARLYRATQGLGKTTTARMVADELWKEGVLRPVLAQPRHRLIGESLPFPWRHLQPRKPLPGVSTDEQPQLCILHEQAQALGNRRWNVTRELCMTDCPIGSSIGGIGKCPYFQQYQETLPLAMVHETLFIPTFCESIFRNGELPLNGITRQAVVLDEPDPSKWIETVNITTTELSKAIARCRDKGMRKLLEVLRGGLESIAQMRIDESKPSEGIGFKFMGTNAMSRLVKCAGGIDAFTQLLQRAQAADEEATATVLVSFDALLGETDKAWTVRIGDEVKHVPKSLSDVVDSETLRVVKWYAEANSLIVLSETPDELTDIPLNFQSDLLRVLQREFELYQTDQPYNSQLTLTRANLPLVRLNLRRSIEVPKNTPVLLLDGQGDAKLLSMLLKRDVSTWDEAPTPDADILQILDGAYGKQSLWNGKAKEPTSSFWRLWDKVVKPLVNTTPAGTLIVTWKVIADHLRGMQEDGELNATIAIEHYGNAEGSNEYENRQQVILLGTPQVSPSDLEEMAQGLFVDEVPISLEVEVVWKPYRYLDTDGSGYQAQVRQYVDERVELLARMSRENELVQCAHRIRPMLTPGKHIVLLTNLPVEELPPTRLATVDELAEEFGTMPTTENGLTFEYVEALAKDLAAEIEGCSLNRLRTRINTEVYRSHYKDISYSDDEKPQCSRDFIPDLRLYRWLTLIAKKNGWQRSRVTVKRNENGGGATSIVVHHAGPIDLEAIRDAYIAELDLKPGESVEIESHPITDAEYQQVLKEEQESQGVFGLGLSDWGLEVSP